MNKKAFDTSLTGEIVKKISELYITNRKTYLILDKSGKYSTVTKEKWGEKYAPLHDGHIERHLRGLATYGVFSGDEISKFMCIDIDMIQKDKLKWIYYIIMESLKEIGVNNKYIHTSLSGNKGLHILFFVQDGSSLKYLKTLFVEVMKLVQEKIDVSINTKLLDGNELKLEVTDICCLEYRNTSTQGVKLELGRNFKNPNNKTNKCSFVDKETLKPKPDEYILSIEPMPKSDFLLLMEGINDVHSKEIIEHISLIKSEITEPHSHKINRDESETITYISNLLLNGLTMSGTRNNAVFKIAKLLRYMGYDLEDAIEELCKWMKWQDKKYYSISLDEALTECERITRNVFEKGYNLVGNIENLYIYKSEITKIMSIKEKNTKIIFFAMLLHSKRYSLKNGVFYMTFKQIEEMTGLGRKAATNNIADLEKLGLLEVVERNIKQDNTHLKKPNRYRIKLNAEQVVDDIMVEVDNTSSNINYLQLYYESTVKLLTNKELINCNLPKYQINEFRKYRKLIS